YSLAVVAFELLSGRRPFDAETPTAEAFGHAHADPPQIDEVNPDLPAALAPVFHRALAKSPDDRPATCAELVSQLRTAFWETELSPTIRPPAPPTRAIAPRGRRRPHYVAALVALALLGVGVGTGVTRGGGHAAGNPPPAKPHTTARRTTPARPASRGTPTT